MHPVTIARCTVNDSTFTFFSQGVDIQVELKIKEIFQRHLPLNVFYRQIQIIQICVLCDFRPIIKNEEVLFINIHKLNSELHLAVEKGDLNRVVDLVEQGADQEN